MQLTWHGHATWHVEVGGTSILIDPFFDNPKTDTDPSELDPDVVLVTHGHDDHVAHLGSFTDATLGGTPEVTAHFASEHGFAEENVVGFNFGGTVQFGDAYVTMHRADHTNGMGEGFTAPSGGSPAGYLISDADPAADAGQATTFYHAGDTSLMSEMKDVIGPHLEPDAAALPSGDHFTMGPKQAAIAADWLDVDYALPMHFDTFPPIELDTAVFEQEVEAHAPNVEPVVLEGDESFSL